MTLNPFRLLRRRQRFNQAVEEEIWLLRRRHGDDAYAAALDKLQAPNLTRWGHRVMEAAAEQLKPPEAPGLDVVENRPSE